MASSDAPMMALARVRVNDAVQEAVYRGIQAADGGTRRANRSTITRIGQNPFQYQIVEGESRRSRVRNFPYVVWYRAR